MNDEKRLSEDELADIRYRDQLPILLVDVSEIRPATLTALIQQLQDTRLDRSALLQHTRALENELHIERAQKYYDAYWKAKWTGTLEEFLAENPEPPQGDWFAKP